MTDTSPHTRLDWDRRHSEGPRTAAEPGTGPTNRASDLSADNTPGSGARLDGEAAPATEPAPTTDESPIRHENRQMRQHVRIEIPFAVAQRGRVYQGRDLSIGSFSVEGDRPDVQDGEAELRLVFDGYHLTLPLTARQVRRSDDGRVVAFEIVEMRDSQRTLLRRLIQAHLSGRHLDVEQVIGREDPQTPPKRKAGAGGGGRRSWIAGIGRAARYGAILAIAVMIAGFVGLSVLQRVMSVEADFAAVTAPEVILRAPISGEASENAVAAGDRVERDQKIVEIVDRDLLADLALAEATFTYNRQLAQNLRDLLQEGGDPAAGDGDDTLVAPEADADGAPDLEAMGPREAQARIDAFETSQDFERARIAALELRAEAGTVRATCDCLVYWSRPGDVWVQKGDRLATLVETDPDRLFVEALVHVDEIDQIRPYQTALVRLPNVGDAIQARVHAINLDRERQPRAGFPDWVSQDQSLASVLLIPEAPLTPDQIGVPVEVEFYDAEPVERLRTLAGRAGDLFSDVANAAIAQVSAPSRARPADG